MQSSRSAGRDPEVARAPGAARPQRAPGEVRLAELALRVVLQGLRGGDGDRRAHRVRTADHVRAGRAARSQRLGGSATRCRSRPRRQCGRAWSCSPRTAATTSSSSVERVDLDRPVYDLNVENTHNFVAGGLVTHNSIYGFRGADIKNILEFEDDFLDAHVGQARAELPLDADDPQRRQRGRSPTTAGARARRCGPTSGRGTRSRSASWATSTPRRGTSRPRSSGWSTRASRARRSRSSTGRTRSRGCSRTCWCARRSATRSSAARSSTSAPRSRTRSRT